MPSDTSSGHYEYGVLLLFAFSVAGYDVAWPPQRALQQDQAVDVRRLGWAKALLGRARPQRGAGFGLVDGGHC